MKSKQNALEPWVRTGFCFPVAHCTLSELLQGLVCLFPRKTHIFFPIRSS